jgi:REP element-mobilizing transposase RayT
MRNAHPCPDAPAGQTAGLPHGWHLDEATGALMRDVIHRMGRRAFRWDYCGKGAYLITMTLADRSRPLFGRLVGDSAEAATIDLSPLGREIDAHLRRIGEHAPEIEVLAAQLMPEHIHAVLRVKRRMEKPLGIALRGFKGGASQIYWRFAAPALMCARSANGGSLCARAAKHGLFSPGFVDSILGDSRAIESAVAYTRDNPRRLWEKRNHPELFQVLRELPVKLTVCTANAQCAPTLPSVGYFSAIGNHALLDAPVIWQVQCSRSWFEYRRATDGALLKDAPPLRITREFEERRDAFLDAAANGAVLLSPCISHGEREIARLAFERGHHVVTLGNKGFNPLYKPGGKLFGRCAGGNLLMLAPAAWPYVPGEKPMTRLDACILNRLAQWIAGSGATEIQYRGVSPAHIDELAAAAVKLALGSAGAQTKGTT